MHRSLELGRAGTEEWIAASQNLTLNGESFSGFTCLRAGATVGLFTRGDFERTLEKASGDGRSSSPVEALK